MVRFLRACSVLFVGAVIVATATAYQKHEDSKLRMRPDSGSRRSTLNHRSTRPAFVPGRARRSSGSSSVGSLQPGTEDAARMVQGILPIDDAAFKAAEDLMDAPEGSKEYRNAQGRLIREATKTTGRMLLDSARETVKTVRDKAFWKGLMGK